jgi:hypothetical protein
VRVWQRGAPADHVAFGLLAGCALSTKDAIGGAYVLPGLALAGLHLRRVAQERGRLDARALRAALLDRRLLALALLPLALFALVQNAPLNPGGLVRHVGFWLEGSEVLDRYRSRGHGAGHLLWRSWLGLEASLGAGMAAFGVAAVLLAPLAHRALFALWLPIVSYGALALAPNFVEPRLLLPLIALVAVAAGAIGARALDGAGALRPAAAALLAAIFVHELGVAVNADLHLLRDPRYAAERWLALHVPRDAQIAALGGRGFMPRLERLGYAPVWFAPPEIRPRAIEVRSFDYAILTQPYHPATDKAWQEDLRNGRTGAPVVFDAHPATPLDRWFGTRLAPNVTRPRVTVVGLDGRSWRPAQRPGTEKR